MKKIILIVSCLALMFTGFGQDARKFYEQGIEQAEAGNFEEAIKLFTKSIDIQPEDYYSWYNRGIAKNRLGLYEESLPDFNQTVKLAPEYKKGYLNRGTTKKRLTDYEGALSDYSYAIKLDTNYPEAYYNRGLVYEMLSIKDSACSDFNKAYENGLKDSKRKVDKCNDTTKSRIIIHPILRLTKTATNKKYGFTSEMPIKVGTGPEGGPGNEKAYLNLLRDAQGKPIKFKRMGSCCDYESGNGLFGTALLDQYEITYLNEKGKEKTSVVYLSFYDYEEPEILLGFKTVGQK